MKISPRIAATASVVVMSLALAVTGCGGSEPAASTSTSGAEGNLAGFIKDIGAELNEFWAAEWGEGWSPAVVKVPTAAAATACGLIDAEETGPAYCDADATMVLPVAFFRDQIIQANDSGRNDAAVAAVVGHEFGHHLQNIGGLGEAVSEAQAEVPDAANLLSVANELHADCLMGIWMSTVDDEKRLEPGDLDEVLTALEKIGDDRLSKDAGVIAEAETFDHGTSEQRQVWFGVGFETQDADACAVVFDDLNDGTLEKELQAGADAANASTTG
jgi:predicted metalloprotease